MRGLILLTGGTTGPLGRLLAEGRHEPRPRLLAQLEEIVPGPTPGGGTAAPRPGGRARGGARAAALADEAGLPIVATNDVYFADAGMHEAHDALLCIAEGRMLAEQDRRRVTPEHWFKPAAAMRALFADLPEACDNTLAIARRCAVMAESASPSCRSAQGRAPA